MTSDRKKAVQTLGLLTGEQESRHLPPQSRSSKAENICQLPSQYAGKKKDFKNLPGTYLLFKKKKN